MVSLEDKISYTLRIRQSPKLMAFDDLIHNKEVTQFSLNDLGASDENYLGIASAISENKKVKFEEFYNKRKRSNPDRDSPAPFVNDDFLIFCIVVGISKFELDPTWIRGIISLRSRNAITVTLENILNGDYYSNSNLCEIVIVYFQLSNTIFVTNDYLTKAFERITENTSLFDCKSDFQILCAIRAYDFIVELKVAPEGSEIKSLQEFEQTFKKRIKNISWLIRTIILCFIIYVSVNLVSINHDVKLLFDKVGSALKILGLVGLSQLGNLVPYLKRIIYEITLRTFGYPRKLAKKASEAINK